MPELRLESRGADMTQIDTSQLGPIKIDPAAQSDARRAKLVRDALRTVAHDLTLQRDHDPAHLLTQVAALDDATLAKLGRMLR